jgi:membrane peptidoglycan carboxypeptidase
MWPVGKARILELYLNTVDWGPGLCGARSAARAYFGKSPARLTALEAAWLASTLRNPHAAWDQQFLARQPDRARATQVLMQMRDWPKRQRERFAAQPLAFARGPMAKRVTAAQGHRAFTDATKRQQRGMHSPQGLVERLVANGVAAAALVSDSGTGSAATGSPYKRVTASA